MDAEEKNFSGRKWTGSRRDAAERESSRVLQNATEAARGRKGEKEGGRRGEKEEERDRERKGGKSTKAGRLRIVTAAGLRGPGGQDAKRRGARRSSPKGEKRYLAMCDSNNESEPS